MDNSQKNQPVYFPQEIFLRKNIKGEEYLAYGYSWYSKELYAMQEPSLYQDESGVESYRFLLLRSFDNPIAIRVFNENDSYFIRLKLCDSQGGIEPGNLVVDLTKSISKQEWEEFQQHLDKIDFWSMGTKDNVIGLDGEEWILEGRKNDRYHLVDRWTPKRNSPYYQCCDYLIQLIGLVFHDKC